MREISAFLCLHVRCYSDEICSEKSCVSPGDGFKTLLWPTDKRRLATSAGDYFIIRSQGKGAVNSFIAGPSTKASLGWLSVCITHLLLCYRRLNLKALKPHNLSSFDKSASQPHISLYNYIHIIFITYYITYNYKLHIIWFVIASVSICIICFIYLKI